jgi:protocatechuate 3,4-dioxygenase beta subunit
MQRRTFIRNTALGAIAVSTSGFIFFNGKQYVGDCETTSDILGPFYRPNSPLRNNLIIKGEPGTPVELSGIIKHDDCTTPYKKAKVELWHCSSLGVYDNSTEEYRYRGTTFTDDNGNYSFNTILPVPYKAGADYWRPAHFHLMITAEGYQPLVTQLYFSGDDHISGDPYAASPNSKRRILDVQTKLDGTKRVAFDVSMAVKLAVEPAAIDMLAGAYVNVKDAKDTNELFVKNKTLWLKNSVYGEDLEYIGNNTFQFPGLPTGMTGAFVFELSAGGGVKCTSSFTGEKGGTETTVYIKSK